MCRMGEVYGKGRKVRCWLGEQLLFFWGDFSCINPQMSEKKWRGYCRVSLWGHDSRSSALLPHSDISPLDGEIHVFPTLGTFLWYLTTRTFYIATEYPTKYCVLEILSSILYHIEYSSDHTRPICREFHKCRILKS